jgi:two-component system, OmpR family, phosphate regulon response regulator OmpR
MTGPKHVLIVEDDQPIRALLADLLAGEGYVVSEAANGLEGLRALTPSRPDVIVLDLMMPGMDGREFARACYGQSPTRPIPTLLVSASPVLWQTADQLRRFGVRACLAKPFDLGVVLETVDRLAQRTEVLAAVS